jgi:para-nitrobenzyl esterase
LDEAEAFLAPHPHTSELTHPEAQEIALAIYGKVGLDSYAALQQRFPAVTPGALFSRLTSDEVFVRPAIEFTECLLARGSSVYLYDFAWKPEGSLFGSCHCLELPFVFGPSDAWSSAPMLAGGSPEALARLSAMIRAAWISFAWTGKPVAADLPTWPAAKPGDLASMCLDVVPRLQQYGAYVG